MLILKPSPRVDFHAAKNVTVAVAMLHKMVKERNRSCEFCLDIKSFHIHMRFIKLPFVIDTSSDEQEAHVMPSIVIIETISAISRRVYTTAFISRPFWLNSSNWKLIRKSYWNLFIFAVGYLYLQLLFTLKNMFSIHSIQIK